jgi:hypothetical protein
LAMNPGKAIDRTPGKKGCSGKFVFRILHSPGALYPRRSDRGNAALTELCGSC